MAERGGISAEPEPGGETLGTDWDEDFTPPDRDLAEVRDAGATSEAAGDYDVGAADDGDEYGGTQAGVPFDADAADYPANEPVRPFAGLAELPASSSEAFEAYKLAILHHKLAGWQEVSRRDLLASLVSCSSNWRWRNPDGMQVKVNNGRLLQAACDTSASIRRPSPTPAVIRARPGQLELGRVLVAELRRWGWPTSPRTSTASSWPRCPATAATMCR